MLRTACIIGWPVAHSRSPLIHRTWLRQFGIDGDYIRAAVEPERFDAFLAAFAENGFVGGNVTIPHKERAFALVAEADPVAAALGAVNTLWLEGDRLFGANTDAYGFLANLDQQAPGWDAAGGPALVLGAGGAARAVLWGLAARGFSPVTVVNRTFHRALALAQRLGEPVRAAEWEKFEALSAGAAILVNTTSLGMAGQPPLDLPLNRLPPHALVTDLVYAPLETPLLTAARLRGLRAVDGLGMLLHQAVPGFERWFGVRPEVTPGLRQRVIADLAPAS